VDWGDENTPGGMKWTTDATTKPNDRYHFDALKQTIRWVCEKCRAEFRDELPVRKHLSSRGFWQSTNPNAPSNARSFHWGALLPWWTSWASQVVEFLSAKAALKWNDPQPLKSFVNETRGLPWTDRLRYVADAKFLQKRVADYDPALKWDREVRRFMTVDVQAREGRHFYLVIRAWGYGGASRLLCAAKVWSWQEVRQFAADWHVNPDNVAFDAAVFSAEVYKMIVDSGYRWKALRGDSRPFFRRGEVNSIYARTDVDPEVGHLMQGRLRPITMYLWSKPSALDRLALFMHGMAGEWLIHKNVDEEYCQQVTAYERRERTDAHGVIRSEWHAKREDHYADCEQMQVVCAAILELLSAPRDPLFAPPQRPPVTA
jgi:hypothetical protein